METEDFLPGWRAVKNLDGYGLGRKIEEAKWYFFYLAGDLRAVALGRKGPGTLRRAVRRILAKRGEGKFNSLEITKAVSKRFLSWKFCWGRPNITISVINESSGDLRVVERRTYPAFVLPVNHASDGC